MKVSTSASVLNCSFRAAHSAAFTLPRMVAEDAGEGSDPQEPQMIALILTVFIFLKLCQCQALSQNKGVEQRRSLYWNLFIAYVLILLDVIRMTIS